MLRRAGLPVLLVVADFVAATPCARGSGVGSSVRGTRAPGNGFSVLPQAERQILRGGMTLQAPVAKQVPHVHRYHGEEIDDPWHWLRRRDDPRVRAYLAQENAYADLMMKHTEDLQETLYDEMVGRIQETDESVPYRKGDYFYSWRTEQGKGYRIHCRRKGRLEAPEEILLDLNALAEGHDHFALGNFAVSPNHGLLAYAVDTNGAERYTLYVKNLRTGEISPALAHDTSYGLVWANDNETLLYTVQDRASRPHQVKRHKLGTDPSADEVLYQEDDERFHLHLYKSRSDRYLLVLLQSQITSEVRFLDADTPGGPLRIVEPRRQRVEYSVVHHGERFFIRTNDQARNFRLMEAPVDDPGRRSWKEVVPHREDVLLTGVDAFREHLVLWEREAGLPHIRIRHLATGREHRVRFDEPVYAVWRGQNAEFDTRVLRFGYGSLTTPSSVFDYDMQSRGRELKKEQPVLGGYDRTRYVTERLMAKAPDGAAVPVSIVYREGLERDGSNPTLLVGYGAYGADYEVEFSSQRLSLLDRGCVFAIAHVRGGSELGRHWYESGKLLQKKNTFTDFVAAAEHLVASGYTSPARLAIRGRSAGGLLMGAVTNMRPDLFGVVVADVPFVDVLNTMMDESLPLVAIEYEEWGNPNEKQCYEYIKSYSPYDNVEAKVYPDMLITAGLHDPRVQYWEPAKWTARLRASWRGRNILLLKTNMEAGHGGASGRYQHLKEQAFEYGFILDRLGVVESAAAADR